MAAKKDRERFTIKFNENDPSHRKVIEILESQGAHSKAPFIVNAILHYIHCPETPDIPVSWLMDKGSIEEMVRGILKEQTSDVAKPKPEIRAQPAVKLQSSANMQPAAATQVTGEIKPEAERQPMENMQPVTDMGQRTEETLATAFHEKQAAPSDKKTEENPARALIMNTLLSLIHI